MEDILKGGGGGRKRTLCPVIHGDSVISIHPLCKIQENRKEEGDTSRMS